MPIARISIQHFLRASEIFIHEHNNYSYSEQALLRAMLVAWMPRLTRATTQKVLEARRPSHSGPLLSNPTFNRGNVTLSVLRGWS